jgi:hypothetical protein
MDASIYDTKNGIALGSDSYMVDNNLYSYDVINGDREVIYKYDRNALWYAKYCTANILMWVEIQPVSYLHKVLLYDLDTKVLRYIVANEGHYGPMCSNTKIVMNPNATGGTVFPLYYLDLEKAGFIKDGHVVPESDGGM